MMSIAEAIKKGSIEMHCATPSCAMIAEEGSQYCSICNGHVKRDKNGFVIWNSKKEVTIIKKEAGNVI